MRALLVQVRRRRGVPVRWLPAVAGCLALLALVACGGQGTPPATADAAGDGPVTDDVADAELVLLFDDVAVPGDAVPAVHNVGRAHVQLRVVTANGGTLAWAEGLGAGMALRTPPFAPEGPVPAAALLATTTAGDDDPLSPGRRAFTLAVDVAADPPEAGRPDDDGDNLVQRGRYGEGLAQYKLQLDHGVPSCRIAGTEGVAELAAPDPVTPGGWYRLTCTRTADQVRLVVLDLEAGSQVLVDEVAEVDVGDVVLDGVPVSVGAKADDGGRLDLAGLDQFHGVIDRVVIDVS